MSYKQNQSYHNKQSEFFSVLCLVGLEDSVNFRDKSQGKVEEIKQSWITFEIQLKIALWPLSQNIWILND